MAVANYFVCMLLLRIALPICLTLAIIFRPAVLSAFYLLLLLYLPVVPVPRARSMAGHTGCYLKIVICISTLTSVAQVAFQIVLFSFPPYGSLLKNDEFLERILRHVGLVSLEELGASDVAQWISPEILMFSASIAIYKSCQVLTQTKLSSNPQALTEAGDSEPVITKPKKPKSRFFITMGKYLALASLAVGACLRPSIPGAFYFLVFLGAATWWSCYKELRKAFAYVCRITLVVLFFHIAALYGYQFQWPQEYLSPNSTYARYFGLTPVISADHEDPRAFVFNDLEWASYLNPVWLLWLYYILALESKWLLMPQIPKTATFSRFTVDSIKRSSLNRQSLRLARSSTNRWQNATRKVRVASVSIRNSLPSENTPLIRGVSPGRHYSSSGRSYTQDPSGSVTITSGEGQDDIPMQPLGKGTAEEELQASWMDNVVIGLASITQVLVRSSYIATNIIMMAWSITYHSWLTFVLLLWANILWLLPNQRRAMLRSSPILVLYAEFLLLSAYVYGMNLTEDELPSRIKNVNLAQIGFEKILVLPCIPLLVKCLYTTMIWITLRQFMYERQEARQTSALADMVAPLQVTVGTATSGNTEAMQEEPESSGSQFMKRLGVAINKILTKLWIWIVAINLFVVAITGERMTGFRIIYMFLFLTFILTFQLSFRIWRKVMYPFWITVIGYSMLTLILVYTYQFDNFPDYWTTYLRIPPEQQLDIGLERYETKQLFVRLLTPTFFVVVTVVQLHYFHKAFLELSSLKSRRSSIAARDDPRSEASSAQGGPWGPVSEITISEPIERPPVTLKSFKQKSQLIEVINYARRKTNRWLNWLWLFLELHINKIVLLIAMLLTVYDTCAIHFVILLLAVVACTLGTKMQTCFIHFCSIIVAVMLLSRMVYQIKYIDHSKWNVTCGDNTTITNVTEYNNAEWLGFYKIIRGRALPTLVKWYIGFILVATVRAIIDIRQQIWRMSQGRPLTRPFFMFPKVTRIDADRSISMCLKYFLNYGFYKFGVEICMMATVALIGTRMDFYACLYGFWLCLMVTAERQKISRIWNWYLAFIVIILPIQYLMVVGIPPGLCVLFPWDYNDNDERLRRMQDWMFLLDLKHAPSSRKLICDIFVLILVARQAIVFRIEKRYEGNDPEYPGGSNGSIIHLIEDPNFVNPVPDFVTYIRSWLDIFKRIVLQCFMWVTLATVFLAGTNRVNIFSLGYFVGSFVFLWQGSDLYLRSTNKILKAWNVLVTYNVFVIIVKTILQIWGCIFINDVNICWLLRLFAIGCIKKFKQSNLLPGISDDDTCTVPRQDIGLAWDGICFGFLIMQRRLFNSYYFFHIVDEAKATTILASRGAELMEDLRTKQMAVKAEGEAKILEKIKHKMDRIKATQMKILGENFKEPEHHYADSIFPGARPLRPRKIPTTYKAAIRSGDYYMFDDLEDDELDLISEKESDEDDIVPKHADDIQRMSVGQFLKQRLSRRPSAPAAVQRWEGFSRRSTRSTRSYLSAPLPQLPQSEKGSPKRSDRSVTIREESTEEEPKPGGSKDIPEDEQSLISAHEGEEVKESKGTMILNFFKTIWQFITSLMNTLTNFLNRFSKNTRYVLRVLAREKKLLKEKTNFRIGLRPERDTTWEPTSSFKTLIKEASEDSADTTASMGDISPTDSYRRALCADRSTEDEHGENGRQASSREPMIALQKRSIDLTDTARRKASVLTVPEIRILAPSLERGLDSSLHSDTSVDVIAEYETAELSHSDQPAIVRLLRSIWFLILSHTDVLCYFVIFLNQIKSASILSLPLPLMVFFWGTLTIPRPSKTFWITIIAYTEVVVLIKCFFQFKILDEVAQTDNNPFYPPKIIGIDRSNSKSTYDLVLLLAVFFHRLMLKTLGLWKTVVDEESNSKMKENEDNEKEIELSENEMQESQLTKDLHIKTDAIKEESEDEDDPNGEAKSGKHMFLKISRKEIPTLSKMPDLLAAGLKKYFESLQKFFHQLRDPTSRITVDVYAFMFMCDFLNFLVVIFGFSAFGTQQGDGGVSAYLQENKVPIPFLVMLLIQFVLIIVDRGLYLRKCILGKIIFQFLQIAVVHIWMFFVLPGITERSFNALLPPPIWYMIKCFYLLLSAYQIRSGYPTRILGNFLCKGYSVLNFMFFKCFMLIPFLFELRTIMDWMWTDTSMTIMDWLKMEDIFAHIFQLKCSRQMESDYPQARGQKKAVVIKYFTGGGMLFGIIAVIWFPLVLFALGNSVGESNIPYDVTLNLRIGPYQPIYSMTVQKNGIYAFSESEFNILNNNYRKDRTALTFLSSYTHGDVAAVMLNGNSTMVWSISPPDIERMISEIESDKDIVLRLQYTISRVSTTKEPGIVISEREVTMPAKTEGEPNPERVKLLKLLRGNETESETASPVTVNEIFPKFVKVTNRNTGTPVTSLLNRGKTSDENSYRNLKMRLKRSKPTPTQSSLMWWELKEDCKDRNYIDIISNIPRQNCEFLVMYTFNDKSFPPTLSWLSGGGIIGLYTTLVFVASRMIRGFFTEICFKIMFDDLPNVDRILQLCLDIYLVREARELCLEEDLFAKLVFLFRSPETLIKWTRPKEEDENEGDDPEDEPQPAIAQ